MRSMIARLVPLVVLLALITPAAATAETYTDPIEISNGDGSAPQLTTDAAGGATVVWSVYRERAGMEGRRVLPGGELTPIADLGEEHNAPFLVGDPFGNSVVLDRKDQIGNPSTGSVGATPMDVEGASGETVGVLPRSGGGNPTGAFDEEGRLTIVFDSYRGNVASARLGDDLHAQSTRKLSGDGLFPQVAISPRGRKTYAWDGGRGVVVRTEKGGELSQPHRINRRNFIVEEVEYSRGRAAVLLATTYGVQREAGLYGLALLAGDGSTRSYVPLGGRGRLAGADIAADGAGGFYAVWSNTRPDALTDYSVKSVHVSRDGSSGKPARLTKESGFAISPQVAVAPRGRAYVVWDVGDHNHGEDGYAIRVATVDRRGRELRTKTVADGGYWPQIAIGPGGLPILAWGAGGVEISRAVR